MASICVYEGERHKDLLPICWMRPVFDLRCGINTLLEKVRREYPRVNTYIFCRDYLVDTVRGKYPGTIINKMGKETSILFLDGSVLFDKDLAKLIPTNGPDELFECDGRIVAARLSKDNLESLKSKINGAVTADLLSDFKGAVRVTAVKARIINFYFDLIRENGEEIGRDFSSKTKGGLIKGRLHQTSVLSPKGRIFIDDGSNIGAFAVLDAKDGPIYIGRGVTVHPHSLIEGPAYIGDHSAVLGGKIRKNTSIGPHSRIGGEVSGTIFQGYVNKQHYGFLGHSYIGEWVNFGAGTTTSNMKNNYGSIRIKYIDQETDSKQMFFGAAIADHVKFGIGTLINSGSVFGVAGNMFGGGIMPKFVSSFAWGGSSGFEVHDVEKAIKTAGAVMKRRGIELTEAEAILFRKIFELTGTERSHLK
ncbi:putative sugar nucleotidyl transferase [Candidatus Margulisiibacteriota bacterium]